MIKCTNGVRVIYNISDSMPTGTATHILREKSKNVYLIRNIKNNPRRKC